MGLVLLIGSRKVWIRAFWQLLARVEQIVASAIRLRSSGLGKSSITLGSRGSLGRNELDRVLGVLVALVCLKTLLLVFFHL